jgi:CRP/FNR family cyclic AMP-dependent transcriptional regulator
MADEAVFNIFRSTTEFESFAANQPIFWEGASADAMWVVKDGAVNILVGDTVIETVEPGSVFGEMALIDHDPRSATAIAKCDCKLVRVDEERFKALVQQHPFFALVVMRIMAQRMRQMDWLVAHPLGSS